MAFITLNSNKLKKNFLFLDKLFEENNITWSVVSKLLCGNRLFMQELINLGVNHLCDSRISNLKMIKSISEDVETIYIKPVPKRSVKSIVKYADISFNTEIETIQLLSEEAVKQNKTHKIIIMIEMGELREGVMRDDLLDFYDTVFKLPNIEVLGLGTNLTCMYGVLPSHDKLIQLCLYKQLIEAKFNQEIKYISGGASVTIPLIFQGLLPKGINHFRIGETLFFGTDIYHNKQFKEMEGDVFEVHAEIIELTEKRMQPDGRMGKNLLGEEIKVDEPINEVSHRALIDIGILDIDSENITPKDEDLEIVGASSDMLVIDLKKNDKEYKVGDFITFRVNYMGVLRMMNSNYINKKVINYNNSTIEFLYDN